jgi:hypothetical protein
MVWVIGLDEGGNSTKVAAPDSKSTASDLTLEWPFQVSFPF